MQTVQFKTLGPMKLRKAIPHQIARFAADRSGAYTVATALSLPALVGVLGLGAEASMNYMKHAALQTAADSAAFSAANALAGGAGDLSLEANGVAGTYGFVNGRDTVVVTVNNPPASGAYTGDAKAVEVRINLAEPRFFTRIFSAQSVLVAARAVAIAAKAGSGCVLALNKTASGAVSGKGTTNIALNGCSLIANSSNASAISMVGNSALSAASVSTVGGVSGADHITTTDGLRTGARAVADPYSRLTVPAYSGCTQTNFTGKGKQTIGPGVYCGGMKINAGANLTLDPGVYIIDGGSFSVNGNATVTGDGVTLVLTSSSGSGYATATINGGATINLTAPTSGQMEGIALYADRNAPSGTALKLNGGSTQNFEGAIYAPTGEIMYAGGAMNNNTCLQLVADTITFTGNSGLANNCTKYGTQAIGGANTALVE